MKKIIIFGATSAIAQACARIWAAGGTEFVLCARDEARLQIVATDLKGRGAANVSTAIFTAESVESCTNSALQALANGCDIALIAHGVLTDQKDCQQNSAALASDIQINFTSYAIIAEVCAKFFEQKRAGTLVLVSSVAGDRGRASNYIYGASKAAVAALASGLRGRLSKVGVNVLTVKPGFVDSPMTAHLKKGALFASTDTVGTLIVKAVESRRTVIYTPGFWRVIMGILAHVPERIFHKLPI